MNRSVCIVCGVIFSLEVEVEVEVGVIDWMLDDSALRIYMTHDDEHGMVWILCLMERLKVC